MLTKQKWHSLLQKLATVSNHHSPIHYPYEWLILGGGAALGAHGLNGLHDVHSLDHLAEDHVVAIGKVIEGMDVVKAIPSITLPKTTWWPSSHCVFTYPLLPFIMATVVMKNCEPLVSGPAFAMDSMPGPVCFSLKFSSGKRSP